MQKIILIFILLTLKVSADEKIKKFCGFVNDIPSSKLLVDSSAGECSKKDKDQNDMNDPNIKTAFGKSFLESRDFFTEKCNKLDDLSEIPHLIIFSTNKCTSKCEKNNEGTSNSAICSNICEAKWSKVSLYLVAALKRNKIRISFQEKEPEPTSKKIINIFKKGEQNK